LCRYKEETMRAIKEDKEKRAEKQRKKESQTD
jgi:hypothetical protein